MESDAFQTIGHLFKNETDVYTIKGDTVVTDALAVMREHRYSQLLVTTDGTMNGEIEGIFSLWTLADYLSLSPTEGIDTFTVADMLTGPPKVTVQERLDHVIELLVQHELLIVDSPHGIQGIATISDALTYFYEVSRPYVLLREIELALREIISECIPDDERSLRIEGPLKHNYERQGRTIPQDIKYLTFDDYRTIITSKDNFSLFEVFFGKNRKSATSRLEKIRIIRNDALHFRDLTVDDYQNLVTVRDMFFLKLGRVSWK